MLRYQAWASVLHVLVIILLIIVFVFVFVLILTLNHVRLTERPQVISIWVGWQMRSRAGSGGLCCCFLPGRRRGTCHLVPDVLCQQYKRLLALPLPQRLGGRQLYLLCTAVLQGHVCLSAAPALCLQAAETTSFKSGCMVRACIQDQQRVR